MWSTNRPEFLIPTLETASKYVDWGDHEVDGVFIDDMPTDRDDDLIRSIAESHGYNHVILHKENKGITYTCKEGYEFIQGLEKEYDFIWHQEDDLIISNYVKIDDLVNYLNENDHKIQARLPYQTDWYKSEEESGHRIKDLPLEEYKNYQIVDGFYWTDISNFDTSFSLTKRKPLFDSLHAWDTGLLDGLVRLEGGINSKRKEYSEATIYACISAYIGHIQNANNLKGYNYEWSQSFYDNNKKPFVEHIGEWSWGQRITPGLFEERIKALNDNPEKYEDAWSYKYQIARLKEMSENPSAKIDSRTWKRL